LASKKNSESAPRVLKLPLSLSDSPLVIDLPDGQKIVIGKMTQGSVIEVATWRGVGRPDSRTSRLMLGVGVGNVNDVNVPAQDSSQPTNSDGLAPKPKGARVILWYLQKFAFTVKRLSLAKKSSAMAISVLSRFKKSPKPAPATPASVETTIKSFQAPLGEVPSRSEETDIEEWLNKITANASRKSTRTAVKTAAKKAVVKKAAPKKLPKKAAKVTPKSK
jgi:hypothetical protein